MIPRTLVPVNVRPVGKDEAKKVGARTTTYMDDRTVIPAGPSEAPPLDGKTSIPAYVPLGVLVDRSLVPRGMPVKPLEKLARAPALPLDILDTRVVVPTNVEPLTAEESHQVEHAPEMTAALREIVEPDIFTTGDTNLLIEPEEKVDPRWKLVTRILSIIVHVAVIAFLLAAPKLFPVHVATQDELDLARKQLQWIYTPPDLPKSAPVTPKLRITPEILKKNSPTLTQPQIPAPQPAPTNPQKPPSDLPEAPRPQPSAPVQPAPAPSQVEPIPAPVRPQSHLNLGLNDSSPGKAIQDQMQDAIRRGRTQSGTYGGGPTGPGHSGPGMGQGYQILSDTQGVDFSAYIRRLLATLRRNWEAVMPTSVYMGDKGIVYTTFQINPDGSVQAPDPTLERTSGKEPLDNAAMAAIHTSNPFEPLPSQFHGPYLKLRIIFLYNIPPDQLNNNP